MPAALWQRIHDDLKAKIDSGEMAPHEPLPHDQDLADSYGVSRITAHRALYELQRIGYVVRKRKAGTVVAELKKSERKTIAAVFFNLGQRFESALLSSITLAIGDEMRVEVAESRHDPVREIEIIRQLSQEAAGIILFPTCDPSTAPALAEICHSGYPLVCVDRFPSQVECDSVLTDNYGATKEGMELLFSRGHRAIAHLTDLETHVASTADRMRAFEDAMTERALDPRRLVRTFPYLAPDSAREYEQAVQLVHDALHAMLSGPEPPTAIFCLRDLYAAAAVEAAERLGLSVPEDLEVMAFLDRQSLLLRRPETVVRIHQDLDEMGRIAVETLKARMADPALRRVSALVPAGFQDRIGGEPEFVPR
jgi:GntR family transcriptional regulator, arabinose operon transcriptional repressor